MRTPIPMLAAAALLAGCVSSPPTESPPLRDMEEPLEFFEPPQDEAARQALPLGAFTGCYVAAAANRSLEALLGDDDADTDGGLTVERVVENSPADAAGIAVGDVLLEAAVDDGALQPLAYPSTWRELELACSAGQRVTVVFDRANRRGRATITVVDRVRPTDRGDVERLREEQRVGVVVRTATEVEARAAGLGPGGGAVVVGLARTSPWRAADLRFGDVLTAVGDRRVDHPQVVLDAIRQADDELVVAWHRDGEAMTTTTRLTEREHEMHEIWIPPLYSYESGRGRSTTSVLLGLFRYESTDAAWRCRLLWLIGFGGGDADRLIEVDG